MKASRYNVVAPDHNGQGGILFNTATQACMLLDDEELASYQAIAQGETEEGPLFDELLRQRFLIDPKTESSYMRHVYRRSKVDNGMLELQICPSLDQDPECNAVFECSRVGVMAQNVQDALLAFVREHHTRSPFLVLKVVWVLGEKLAGLDVVK